MFSGGFGVSTGEIGRYIINKLKNNSFKRESSPVTEQIMKKDHQPILCHNFFSPRTLVVGILVSCYLNRINGFLF